MLMNQFDVDIFGNILERINLKKYYLKIYLPNTKYINFLQQLEDFRQTVEDDSEDNCEEIGVHSVRSKFKELEKIYIKTSRELQNEYNTIKNNFSEKLLDDFINEIHKSEELIENYVSEFLAKIHLRLKDVYDIKLIYHIEGILQDIESKIIVIKTNFKNWEHSTKYQNNGDTLKYFYSLLIKYLNTEYLDVELLEYEYSQNNMSISTLGDDFVPTDDQNKQFLPLKGRLSLNKLKGVSNPETNSVLNEALEEFTKLNKIMDGINKDISDKILRFKHDIYNIEQERDIVLQAQSLEQNKKMEAIETLNEAAKKLKSQHEELIKDLELKRSELRKIAEFQVQRIDIIKNHTQQENIGVINKSSDLEHSILSSDVPSSDEDDFLLKADFIQVNQKNSFDEDVLQINTEKNVDLEKMSQSTMPDESNSENESFLYKYVKISQTDASSEGSRIKNLEQHKKMKTEETLNTHLENQMTNHDLQKIEVHKVTKLKDIIKENLTQETVTNIKKSTEFEPEISSSDVLKSDDDSSLLEEFKDNLNKQFVSLKVRGSSLNKLKNVSNSKHNSEQNEMEILRLDQILERINKDKLDNLLKLKQNIYNIEQERDMILKSQSLEQNKKMEALENLNDMVNKCKKQHEGLIMNLDLKSTEVYKIKENFLPKNIGGTSKFEKKISSSDMLKSEKTGFLLESDLIPMKKEKVSEYSLDTDESKEKVDKENSTIPDESNSEEMLKLVENIVHRGNAINSHTTTENSQYENASILRNDASSEDIQNLDDKTYIKKYLGKDLIKALADAAVYEPRDPISYVANCLIKKNQK